MDYYRLTGTAIVDGKVKTVSFRSHERDSETSDRTEHQIEFFMACAGKGWEPIELLEAEYL